MDKDVIEQNWEGLYKSTQMELEEKEKCLVDAGRQIELLSEHIDNWQEAQMNTINDYQNLEKKYILVMEELLKYRTAEVNQLRTMITREQ